LYFLQSAASAVGSAVTQRGDEVVSGRMMPTLAPLPSTVPPELLLDVVLAGADEPAALLELPPPLFPLELHAVRASTAAPSTAIETVVLRMRRSRLSAREAPNLFGRAP
jgi:hypothetical protein